MVYDASDITIGYTVEEDFAMDKHNKIKNKSTKPKSGPDPETLKLDGDWEEAVKQSLNKPKPDTDSKKDDGPDTPPGPIED